MQAAHTCEGQRAVHQLQRSSAATETKKMPREKTTTAKEGGLADEDIVRNRQLGNSTPPLTMKRSPSCHGFRIFPHESRLFLRDPGVIEKTTI